MCDGECRDRRIYPQQLRSAPAEYTRPLELHVHILQDIARNMTQLGWQPNLLDHIIYYPGMNFRHRWLPSARHVSINYLFYFSLLTEVLILT